MTRQGIIEAIKEISDSMKGPVSDIERRLLHEDRKVLRIMLGGIGGMNEHPRQETCLDPDVKRAGEETR